MPPLLEVKDLQTYFFIDNTTVKAVDGVSFDIHEGETLGLVGESGCGKSVSALSILRLIPNPPGEIIDGEIFFEGKDLLNLTDEEIRHVRGNRIAMIFQEPMTSLNPVLTIGRQIAEPMEVHKGMKLKEALEQSKDLLSKVQIAEAERRIRDYPHQFSGGMRQRAMISMGLGCNPKLIIADEPTTALDVTIQAQILELLKDLTRDFNMALIIITHNLGVVARYADRVNVFVGKDCHNTISNLISPGYCDAAIPARFSEANQMLSIDALPSLYSCRQVMILNKILFAVHAEWLTHRLRARHPLASPPLCSTTSWRNPLTSLERCRMVHQIEASLQMSGSHICL